MKYSDLKTVQFVVGLAGGELVALSPDRSEIWRLGLAAGVHAGTPFLPLLPTTAQLELAGDVVAVQRGGARLARSRYGDGATQSGANPDFTPGRLTDAELRMRKMMQTVLERSDAVDRRARALERISADKAQHIAQKEAEPLVEADEPVADEPAAAPAS